MLCSNQNIDARARQYLFILCISFILNIDIDFQGSEVIMQDVLNLFPSDEVYLSDFIPLDISYIKKIIDNYTNPLIDYQKCLLKKEKTIQF